MRSFNVLSPDQKILGPRFLEASAGTGKTFTIEHLVVRLLLESSMTIDKILLVTFTRAATRELRQRVRSCIEQSVEGLIHKKKRAPYLAAVEEETTALTKLKEALSMADQMQVFTIHGFCQRMLKTYAFEAKLGFGKLDGQEKAYQEIEKEQILYFLRMDLRSYGFHKHQIRHLLQKMRNDIQAIVRKLLGILHQDAMIHKLPSYDELLIQFNHEMAQAPFDKELFLTQLLQVAPLFKGIVSRQKEMHPEFHEQAALIADGFEQGYVETFEKLLAYDTSLFECFQESHLKKTSKYSFSELLEKYPLIGFGEKLYAILKEAKNISSILLRLAEPIRKRIENAFAFHGVITPDDLLQQMRRSVDLPSFCQKVQGCYEAAIIDEFQDTDPLQWAIFHTLFVKERPSFPLYLVGDPKQSIYGFRNADLPTYLRASENFAPENKLSLNVNYRSRPVLVDALNRLFLAEPTWLSQDNSLSYEEVLPNPMEINGEDSDKEAPVHFFIAEQEEGKERRFPSDQVEEEQLFPFIACEIIRRRSQGKNFNSFAVLIRDRFQGERIGRYLKGKNIPTMMTSTVHLGDTLAFSFLTAFIQMLGHSNDMQVLKQILVHPFIGFSHDHLRVGSMSFQALKAITHLRMIAKVYEEHHVLRAWDLLLQTVFHEDGSSFEEELVRVDLQSYQDLVQLVELLAEEPRQERMSYDALLYATARLAEKDPDTHEYVKRRVASGEDAVTIMTMHKSKGLEFDIVFALGLVSRTSFKGDIIKCDDTLVVASEDDLDHKEVFHKQEEEKLRQLYVALTRAKSTVYIPLCFYQEKEGDGDAPIELFLKKLVKSLNKKEVLLALKKIDPVGFAFTCLAEEKPQLVINNTSEQSLEILKPEAFTRVFPVKYSSSYSKMAQETEGIIERKIIETPLLPPGAETGHVLHKILEKIFERGWYLNPSEERLKALITQETLLSSLVSLEEEVKRLIDLALAVEFTDGEKTFSFQNIHPSHLMTEMEFMLEESSSQYFKGVIDLCFIYENRWYLVDWKSNYLGLESHHYDLASLKKSMEENQYMLQAELYGNAIRAHLRKLGHSDELYGGIFYVFLRGLEHNQGIYHCR